MSSQTEPRSVSLTWLLDGIASVRPTDARVVDLTLDSRQVRAGSLFFALPGRESHGLEFALQACARGASVVLWEPAAGLAPPELPDVFAADVVGLSRLVGRIADRFFDRPSSQLRVVGITGTNGKTTCAYLLAQCLESLGRPAAYMGTIGWGRPAALEQPTHTTPDVVTLHRQLDSLRAAGVRDVAMEVSSHALDQDRIAGVRFHSAAFTNLSRDHLDYHRSMSAYADAKARLFAVPGLERAIVNVGDEFGRELAQRLTGRLPLTVVWLGSEGSDWTTEQTVHSAGLNVEPRGFSMELTGSYGAAALHARLIGRFNAENCLVVLACLASMGVPLPAAVAVLAGCKAPPGRMEVIEAAGAGKALAVIDYAHTPDALSKALQALRSHCRGALWCVFGCGGDRDPGKRPMMGAVADELADQIIVTDDNPRSERPDAITRDIAAGITAHAVRVIHDRAEAIATALAEADSIDVVLIAGKGHEEYQIYGQSRREFSDRREALRHLGAAA
jgi:UDP-N-acetylmuramoyl-L-alanyl-D-glutamate--2,6-diaminopimelate ligase